MPQIRYPVVKLVNGGTTFIASNNGVNRLEYQPNAPQTAVITIDNTVGTYDWTTNDPEDRVTVLVNDGSTDYEMLDGYLTSVKNIKQSGGRLLQVVKVSDFIGYLAPKTIFEKSYFKATPADDIITDSAGEISGITTTNVSSALSTTIQKEFLGSVKDCWNYTGDLGDANWFGDETLDLHAFPTSGANREELQTGGTTYKIKDASASLSHEILLDHRLEYSYDLDATERVRSVYVTNGLTRTFPNVANLDAFQTSTYWNDQYGKNFAIYYQHWNDSDFAPASSSVYPISTNDNSLTINGSTIPAIRLNPATTASTLLIQVMGVDYTTGVNKLLVVPIDDFSEIRFFMRNQLATAAVTDIRIELTDLLGVDYWYYDIKKSGVGSYDDLNGTDWTWLRYTLPTSSSLGSTPTWTKVGTPTKIDLIAFRFTPTSGYTGYVAFAQLHLWGRQRKSNTVGGSIPSEKLIVDRSLKDATTLQNRADKEQNRINRDAKRGSVTILGHTDFKRPGYYIDIDFTNKLGANAIGNVRMNKIIHNLTPTWTTTIELDNAYQRF